MEAIDRQSKNEIAFDESKLITTKRTSYEQIGLALCLM